MVLFQDNPLSMQYAHQDEKVQKLMEKIALVLIDLNGAVENGYVELNQFIEEFKAIGYTREDLIDIISRKY